MYMFIFLLRLLDSSFWEFPYGPGSSTPWNWDSAWVEPSEMQNLRTEIGRVPTPLNSPPWSRVSQRTHGLGAAATVAEVLWECRGGVRRQFKFIKSDFWGWGLSVALISYLFGVGVGSGPRGPHPIRLSLSLSLCLSPSLSAAASSAGPRAATPSFELPANPDSHATVRPRGRRETTKLKVLNYYYWKAIKLWLIMYYYN